MDISTLTLLSTSTLSPGVLPFCLYDLHGGLLFNKGVVLESVEEIKHLITQKVCYQQDSLSALQKENSNDAIDEGNSAPDIFTQIEHIIGLLFLLCGRTPTNNFDFSSNLMALTDRIQTICDTNSKAAMASLLLIEGMNYPIKHAVDVAILTEILTKKVRLIKMNDDHL